MAVQQAERPAEQVDARRDHRRPHAVVVERQRLDQIVEMAFVIRDVDDPPGAGRILRDPHAFVDALDLAENRIERMLERAVDRIPLRGAKLVEIRVDPLACLELGLPVAAAQVSRYILARQHGLRDVIEHCAALYHPFVFRSPAPTPLYVASSAQTASVNAVVLAEPPRSRVRTRPAASTRSSAARMRALCCCSPM
jgi:hypothetical protein